MTTDLTTVYRSLDPLSPLEPSSDLYVERPDNPMDRVAVELELSDRPRHYLLVGHRGTGKTTELWRLAHALVGERKVFMVDVGDSSKLAKADSENILVEALQSRLDYYSQDQERLVTAIELVSDYWYGTSALPSLVVFDGLERLQRDEDILRALTGPPPVYGWTTSVICTIPLSLYLSQDFGDYARHFDQTIFLPGIPTVSRAGKPDHRGINTLTWIIEQRAGKGAFEHGALLALIGQSAGIHRELLRLAQRACVVAALGGAARVSRAHAEAAIAEQRNEYSILLRTHDYPLLEEVMETQQLRGGEDADRLIRNQLIVAYANGTTWFDVHPIVLPLLERKVRA